MAKSELAPSTPAGLPLPSSLFGRTIFYGWYIVVVACLVTMMSSGIQAYGLGVFVKPMTEELGWSRTDISLGQTLSTGVMGVVGLFIGGLMDRRGGRELIVVGAVLSGLAYMLLSQVQELWQYYLIKGAVLTLGMGAMGGMVLNVAVSNWFVHRRGRAIAITAMGISFGAAIVPPLSAWLIESIGWRSTWVVIGASIWVLVIPPAWLVMRRRPEDFGLQPDGVAPTARMGTLAAQRAAVDRLRWTRRQAMRTPTLWMLIAVFGLGSMGFGALLLHLVPFLTDRGYSSTQAAGAFSMIGFSGLVSKPVWGLIAERVEARYAAAAEFVLLALGILAIYAAPTLPLMYGAILFFGVGIGGVVTIQETVWADYFGRLTLASVRSIGRTFTIVFSAGGPVLAGLAYDLRDSYDSAFLVFIVAYVVATVMVLMTPMPRHPDEARPREAGEVEGRLRSQEVRA